MSEIPATPSVIAPGHTFGTVTDKISSIVLTRKTSRGWYAGFGFAFFLTLILFVSLANLLVNGIGIWGNNVPVGWAFEITNFVWWIGIGHAGTLISAILLLLKQTWRTSINRFAEAMTLFAVACAGIFPAIHTGRPWLDYWLLPYPNTMGVWPQFRSPIMWDVFAVSTYATVSLLFWFVGLIPDLATLRDRSQSRTGRMVYGLLAMGWRGSRTAQRHSGPVPRPVMIGRRQISSEDGRFPVNVSASQHRAKEPLLWCPAIVQAQSVPDRRKYTGRISLLAGMTAISKVDAGLHVAWGRAREGYWQVRAPCTPRLGLEFGAQNGWAMRPVCGIEFVTIITIRDRERKCRLGSQHVSGRRADARTAA